MMFTSAGKKRSVAIATVLLVLGLAIIWLDFWHQVSPWRTLATVAYAFLTAVLFLTGALELPGRLNVARVDVWRRLSDVVKCVISFAVAIGWVAISVKLVPDTDLGVAIILVPSGVLCLLGGFFYARSAWISVK